MTKFTPFEHALSNFLRGNISNGEYARQFTVVFYAPGRYRVDVASTLANQPVFAADPNDTKNSELLRLKLVEDVNIVFQINDHIPVDELGEQLDRFNVELAVIDQKIVMHASTSHTSEQVASWHVAEYDVDRYLNIIYLCSTGNSLLKVMLKDLQKGFIFLPIPQKCMIYAEMGSKSWNHRVAAPSFVNQGKQCVYEMLGLNANKMYLDLDYLNDGDAIVTVKRYVTKLKEIFLSEFSETVGDHQIVVLRSFPNKQSTASFHIIVNSRKAFVNPSSTHFLLQKYQMFDKIDNYAPDSAVYKQWQKFRVVNSFKSVNDKRVFRRVRIDDHEPIACDPADTLIQSYQDTYANINVRDITYDPKNLFQSVMPMSDAAFTVFERRCITAFETQMLKTWSGKHAKLLANALRSMENSERMYFLFAHLIEIVVETSDISARHLLYPQDMKLQTSNPARTDTPWANAIYISSEMFPQFLKSLFVAGINHHDNKIKINFSLAHNFVFLSSLDDQASIDVCTSRNMVLHQVRNASHYVFLLSIPYDATITVNMRGDGQSHEFTSSTGLINLTAMNCSAVDMPSKIQVALAADAQTTAQHYTFGDEIEFNITFEMPEKVSKFSILDDVLTADGPDPNAIYLGLNDEPDEAAVSPRSSSPVARLADDIRNYEIDEDAPTAFQFA